jgi:hypothetical protein
VRPRFAGLILTAWTVMSSCTCLAAHFYDDFTSGSSDWRLAAEWAVTVAPSGEGRLVADAASDSFAWNMAVTLDTSWSIECDVNFDKLLAVGGRDGVASIAIAEGPTRALRVLAAIQHNASGEVSIGLQYLDGRWHSIVEAPWQRGVVPDYHLRLERLPGSDRLRFTVSCTNGFRFASDSNPVPVNDN